MILELKEFKDLEAHKVQLVLQATEEILVCQDLKDSQDLKVLLVIKD